MRLDYINEHRDFITIMLGRGLQAITAFATTRLLTSFLLPQEVGRCSILASLTSFFSLLLISPVGTYINRKTHEWYRNGTMRSNLYLYWLYLLAIALFALIVLLLLKSTVGLGIEITWFWLLIIVAGSLLFNTGNSTITSILNMLGNRIAYVVLTLLTLWVGLGLSVLFITQIDGSAEYWLSGGILSLLVIFWGAYGYLVRGLNHARNGVRSESLSIPRWETFLPVLRFAWPLAITAGLGWVQSQSYRFVLSHFGGLSALGLFDVGYGIGASFLGIFFNIFMQYYYPIFYREVSNANSEGRRASWNKLAAYLFPAALLMAAFVIACAPYLTKLMVAAEFQASEPFILWGALFYLVFIVNGGFSMIAHAEMKTSWLIRPAVTGAILALGGVLLLTRWNPQVGTCIALATAELAMTVHLAIKLHKEVAFSLPWRRIFISIAFSIPLLGILLTVVNPLIGQPTYIQSILVLAIAGSYLLVGQYLLSTRWIKTVN